MRRHAKASPAGSTQRQASGLGGFVRGAFATGASSRSADGSGARSFATAALALASAVFLSLLIVSSAGAASQRPFKEVFGSAAQPSFEWSLHIATDRSTGDVLIGNFLAGTVSRFHADGTPAPFSALGTNVIDGREENGKPCAEEPASCDKTSQGELALNGAEIAIDESGGVTDGDIYLTQPDGGQMMYIFDPDGSYLGQITKAGNDSFLGSPRGVAVDSTGTVYLVAGGRILKYVPTASPLANSDYVSTLANLGTSTLGAIALGSGPTANLIFGASNGGFTSQAYQISKETGELEYTFADGYGVSQVAVDPGTGNVLVRNNSRQQEVGEFEAQSGSAPVKVGRILTPARAEGFAMNASGEVYVSEGYGVPNVSVFGTPAAVPSVTVEPASNITGASAILLGTVNPSGLEVTECFFEYEGEGTGGTIPCEGSIPTDSSPHAVHATLSGLEPNGREYRFRLVAKNANGREESSFLTLTTAFTTTTEAAAPVGSTTATLNGVVRPEGTPYTQCLFEYGLTSSAHFTNTAPCNPSALGIPADFSPHAVTAAITGLQVGKAYRFRLVAANENGPQKGRELTFETNGPPQVSAIGALNADQESATLEAKINPSGFGTSYRFEWGPTASYGNSIPLDFEPYVGEGVNPVQVSAKLSGLSAGTVYHYRVVARSKAGKTESPDQILETLNSCGLPEGRCLELVSPRDAGPVGIPGKFIGSAELHLQAADQPGLFAYVVETGFPDAPKGAESFYRGTRGSDGWSSTALSAPILAPNESGAGTSNSSKVLGLSENLSCSIEESNQLLTSDPSTRIVREAGGANLYRRDSAGSYTALTLLPPEGVEDESGLGEIDEYELEGFSRDCGKVVFSTHYRYPGVEALPSAGGGGFLYEWEDDTLRSVGFVPGPSGEVAVHAIAGAQENNTNAVSRDGTRIFFSAERQASSNPAEIGATGVFVRENGTSTRDLSLSETATPDTGATYQYASKDGSRVFFTANAGLTAKSSTEGEDLYEYDLEAEQLTDLSVSQEEGGAQVGGFVGASEDGSHVYFIARGQLVPGRGSTLAQNQSANTYSLYGAQGGKVSFVATVDGGTSELDVLLVGQFSTSRVTPDGRYLLFETTANATGYEAGNHVAEAYLYDADATSEPTVCVSCRQDGEPSASPNGNSPLRAEGFGNPLYRLASLAEKEGRAEVYFTSFDRLAPGAVEGRTNIYEWSHGQVFRIETEPPGLAGPIHEESASGVTRRQAEEHVLFAGSSPDGTDLYFATPQTLSWEDGDARTSVYDARVGGGFPEPAAPPPPCNPTAEGSCTGSPAAGPASPAVGSSTFSGPGNEKGASQQPKQPKKKHKKKPNKKKSGHTNKKQGNGKRHAKGNRRAGK